VHEIVLCAVILGCAGELPAKRRRVGPVSVTRATAPRLLASSAVRSHTGGLDQNRAYPLGFGPPWTRAPSSRRGPRHHSRWIDDPRLNGAIFV
jgi:hypothetical protein